MSENNCPNCGRPSKAGMKYCMYCGTRFEEDEEEWFGGETKAKAPEFESLKETTEKPDEKEEIPQDLRNQFELRARLEEIIGETSALSGEIDRLMEGLSGDISIEEYKEKIKSLKNRVTELKKEREEVEKMIKPLPLEQLSREKDEIQERLAKLKEVYKSREISNETFERLNKEYESEFLEIKKKHKKEKSRVENWIAQLETDRKVIKERSEFLYARYKTGEVSVEEYQKDKKDLKKELGSIQLGLESLRIEVRQWG